MKVFEIVSLTEKIINRYIDNFPWIPGQHQLKHKIVIMCKGPQPTPRHSLQANSICHELWIYSDLHNPELMCWKQGYVTYWLKLGTNEALWVNLDSEKWLRHIFCGGVYLDIFHGSLQLTALHSWIVKQNSGKVQCGERKRTPNHDVLFRWVCSFLK